MVQSTDRSGCVVSPKVLGSPRVNPSPPPPDLVNALVSFLAISLLDRAGAILKVEVWDWDRSSADDPLGHFEVTIGEELLSQEVGACRWGGGGGAESFPVPSWRLDPTSGHGEAGYPWRVEDVGASSRGSVEDARAHTTVLVTF